MPLEAGKKPQPSWLNSNQQEVREDLKYNKEDLLAVEEWVKVSFITIPTPSQRSRAC